MSEDPNAPGRSGYAVADKTGATPDTTSGNPAAVPSFTSDTVPTEHNTARESSADRTDPAETERQAAISAGEAHRRAMELMSKDANPTTTAKNTLADAPKEGEDRAPIGQVREASDSEDRTVAAPVAADRPGPGTGDGTDTRPLGDPTAPQGTGREVPGQQTQPPELRPAPAGQIRTSWAESGDHTK